MNETALLYAWWGYAEAEPTLVGILVAVIAVLAVVYVITRLVRGRGPRARPGKKAGSRR
jgi:high-affinity Fe2+/Pb2+ permease